VRPDDLDTIFDDALFGAPVPEATAEQVTSQAEASARVQVGAVEWFMERDSQASGPFRLERLRELWHQGGLSPDTLMWCEGWSGWQTLSRVPELVAALTDAGLPTVGADASVAVVAKPTVSSALTSLVAEEESWLLRMKAEREQAKEDARAALLDAPSAPVPAPAPVVMAPVVPVAPPVIPALVLPMAPEAPAPTRRGRGIVLGALMGSTAVGLVAGALLLLPRLQGSPEPAPVVAAQAALIPAPAPVAVMPRPVPPPVQAPTAEAPKPAAPVVAVAPVAQPAAPAPQPPAPVVPPVEKPAPQVVTAAAEKPPKVIVAAARPVEQERITRVAESALQRRTPPPPPAPVPVAPPVKVEGRKALQNNTPGANLNNYEDSVDKEFERELFEAKKPEDPRSKRTVYLPPEPG
jgi:hypothetical protein